MNPTHVVLRPIEAGAKRIPGEMVDARAWRHVEYFCETRRLRPVMVGEHAVPCGCGRMWLDATMAANHCEGREQREPALVGAAPQSQQPAYEPKGAFGRPLTDAQKAYYARNKKPS